MSDVKTAEQFYDSFKAAYEAKDETAINVANMITEAGKPLGRKLTKQEAVALIWSHAPEGSRPSFQDFPDAKIRETLDGPLKGLVQLAGDGKKPPAPDPKTPPEPVKSKSPSFMESAVINPAKEVYSGYLEGTGSLLNTLANVPMMVGAKGPEKYLRDQSKAFKGKSKEVAPKQETFTSPIYKGIGSAVPAVATYAPAMAAGPVGAAAIMGGIGALESADQGVWPAVQAGVGAALAGKYLKLVNEVPGLKRLVLAGAPNMTIDLIHGLENGDDPMAIIKKMTASGTTMAALVTADPKGVKDALVEAKRILPEGVKTVAKKVTAPLRKAGQKWQQAIAPKPQGIGSLPPEPVVEPEAADPTRHTEADIPDLVKEGKEAAARGDYDKANYAWGLAKRLGWSGNTSPNQAEAPPEPVRESPDAPANRTAAAAGRAKNPQEIPGLGQRIAPEETGELVPPKEPISRSVGPEKDARAPQAPEKPKLDAKGKPIETSDFEKNLNPDAQQYTAEKLPGVPAGTTIIPRGSTPGGFLIDVVDANGRMTQKTLPFNDSLKRMIDKGWLKEKAAPAGKTTPHWTIVNGQPTLVGSTDSTFRSQEPEATPGVSVPPEIVDERGPGSSELLPATIPPNAGPPPGGFQLLTPEQLAAAVNRANPKLLPAAQEPTTQSMDPLKEASVGLTQSPEVLANVARQMSPEARAQYVGKIQQAFIDQLQHLTAPTAEQQAQIQQVYQKLQDYLKPFLAEAPKPAESNGGHADNPMPSGMEAQVKNMAETIAAKGGAVSEAWKNITVQPMSADLKKPIGKPVTMPIGEFNGQAVWRVLSGAQGVGGIKLTDPDFGASSGSVIRPLDMGSSAPPEPVRR